MQVYNSLKDPLNFDRVFQLQRITRNLANDHNSVSAIEITPQGEPSFSLSISTDVTELEFPKGDNNTTKKSIVVTNTGNAQVVIGATVTGNDTSYFSVSPAQQTIDVGKSVTFVVSTQNTAGSSTPNTDADIYISSIVFDDIRTYRTMTSKTVKLGHINNDNQRALTLGAFVDQNDIFSSMSSVVNVNVNRVTKGGTNYNLPQEIQVDSLFDSFSWFVSVSYSGSGTPGTMQLRESTTARKSTTINYPNPSGSISIGKYWDWVNSGYSISNVNLNFA
jgi:hypothetical protein